jgi:hypothetical protein
VDIQDVYMYGPEKAFGEYVHLEELALLERWRMMFFLQWLCALQLERHFLEEGWYGLATNARGSGGGH